MVAFCNICPGVSQAIAWYKFNDGVWKSYRPTTFPFSWEKINNGDGTWKLNFRVNPKAIVGHDVRIQYTSVRNILINTAPNSQLAFAPLGQNPFVEFVYGSDVRVRVRGLCGDYVTPSLVNSPAYNCFDQYCVKAGTLPVITSITPKITYNNISPNCPGCPIAWDDKIFETTGQGEPQVQITCGSNKCPPDTACECTRNGHTCCYGSNGEVTYYF